ncbi:hypothetical protein [Pseudomonas sp. BW7P1]|uniref:hypothetical protein n=1 Tax=Pseudomonas TaxID=286 RepID=UPI0021AD66D7|nr:hypothetical protein [Pseudomonas sp. BW7P1]UWI59518.1 hypothetical protein NWV16_15500 [Pseudomonas sp. BW7P1]
MGTTAEVLVRNVPSDVPSLVAWFPEKYGFNVVSETRIGKNIQVVYDLALPRMATANRKMGLYITDVVYER